MLNKLNSAKNPLILPLVLVICLVIKGLPVLSWGFNAVINSFIHEIGHAAAYWLAGRFSVPTPLFVAIVYNEQFSWLVFTPLYGALLGILLFAAKREDFALATFAGFFLILQFVCSFAMSDRASEIFAIWGGVAGEFYVSSFFIILYYYAKSLPDRWNWQLNRYLFLVPGMYCFLSASVQWIGIAFGKKELPFGTAWGGSRDPHGDLNRLRDEFLWTEQMIIGSYLALGICCFLVILSHYVYFTFLERSNFSCSEKLKSDPNTKSGYS